MKKRGILFFFSLTIFFFLFPLSFSKLFAVSKATYTIRETKNEKGEVLSSVKVYVDDVYLHHYAPEVLTFCESCQCDTYTDCGFGEHKISLQKSGYLEWFEVVTFKEGDVFEVNPVLLVLVPMPTPTLLPTSIPSFSPTLTPFPSPTVTPLPGFYNIKSVKDSSGAVLNNVKVFVDGNYVHHYAPEILKFCWDCQCDEGVLCNFGSHTFGLEKEGYNSWSETKTINPGDNFEVDPVMLLLPSPTPSPKAVFISSVPTTFPSSTPTPAAVILFASFSADSTAEAEKMNISTGEPDILGEFSSESGIILEESSFSAKTQEKKSFRYLPFLTIFGGVWLVGAAVYLFFFKKEV